MNFKRLMHLTFLVCLMVQLVWPLSTIAKDWTGSVDSDWFNGANWNPSGVPGDGETAVMSSVGSQPLLTNSTANLVALTITSGTLTCSNWTTTINAGTVTIQSGGKITLPAAFTDSQMSNRVRVVCTDLTVNSDGMIDADQKGFAVGYGPGKGNGTDKTGGSGYGGRGGYGWQYVKEFYAGGPAYGSESDPNEPGSGAPLGYAGLSAGKGGGIIRIEATGSVTINGIISANGGPGTVAGHAAGGSGGGVFVSCNTFQGSASGLISANGGNYAWNDGNGNGGSGGGGRIALIYTSCNLPSVRLSAARGISYSPFEDGEERFAAQIGTIYLSSSEILSQNLSGITGRLIIPGFSTWSPASLTITNGMVELGSVSLNVGSLEVKGAGTQLRMGPSSALACTGSLLVNGGKLFVDSNSTVSCGSATVNGGSLLVKGNLTCGTDFLLTNSGTFYNYSGVSNGTAWAYGSRVVVTGNMTIASSSWVYPCSHPVNGGSPLFELSNLTIETNAGFNAVGQGYDVGQGPGTVAGALDKAPGASHAGKGGKSSDTGYIPAATYGSSNAPVEAGSGAPISFAGATVNVGPGGGLIRLEVTGCITLNGSLNASGQDGFSGWSGGGAGGSVFVITRRLESSSNSLIYAKGGTGGGNGQGWGGGGGGGGRIALYVGPDRQQVEDFVNLGRGAPDLYTRFPGMVSVTNGLGFFNPPSADAAQPGTCVMYQLVRRGTVITIK